MAQAVTPAYPDSARDLGLGPVVVYVQVTVNPDGTIARAVITQSSNNSAIDQAALRAARTSTYSPKLVGCNAVTGTNVFPINMIPGSAGTVRHLAIMQSSNDAAMDQAAMRAARDPTYAPRAVGCRAVSGEYIFRVDFGPHP